jgi:formate-dependent phosphoribosylglycinamide formyltransferase (GAR transformylase)
MPDRVMLILPTQTYRAAAFLRAASALGLPAVVASNEAQSLARLMDGRVLTLDLGRPQESAVRATEFAARWPVAAVVGVDEASVLTAAHVAAALGIVRRNSVEAVAATRDKRLLRHRLAAAAVTQPRFVEIGSDADTAAITAAVAAVGLPCVVKPVDLAASRGVIRADNVAAVTAAIERTGTLLRSICGDGGAQPLLVESYVDGVEVAVEGLLRDGRLDVLAVFDKPDPLVGPFFEETMLVTPSRLVAPLKEAAVDAVRRGVAALGLGHGPIHAEVRLAGERAFLIEIAARSIGGLCSAAIRLGGDDAAQADMSLEEVILRQACGLPLGTLRLTPGGSGVLMIPIHQGGVLQGVDGVDAARDVDGITGVTISIPAGETVTPLPEGDRYLGFVSARGDTPAYVEAALRRAHSLLRVDITSADKGDDEAGLSHVVGDDDRQPRSSEPAHEAIPGDQRVGDHEQSRAGAGQR